MFERSLSSLLKVQELYTIGKDEEKEYTPTDVYHSNNRKKVILKPKHFLNVSLHWYVSRSRYLKRRVFVTHLRRNKAIECPSHRSSPIVPPPPYRDLLQ